MSEGKPGAGIEGSEGGPSYAGAVAAGAIPAEAKTAPPAGGRAPKPAPASFVPCPKCGWRLEVPMQGGMLHDVSCRSCGREAQVELFPAFVQGERIGSSGTMAIGEEAACFRHENKRAEAACDMCGRYVCAVCDIQMGERHVCVECFEKGRRGNALPAIVRFKFVPASLGVWLAIISFFIPMLGAITGFGAIVLGVWGMFAKPGPTGQRRIGVAILSLCLGLLALAIWVAFIVAVVADGPRRGRM